MAHKCNGNNKMITAKTNCSHQKQIAHIKNKLFTSKANCSHQKQIAHIKSKLLTSNSNCSHQIQIAHIKFKLLTSNSNRSHQNQKENKIITHWSAATLKRLSPVFTRPPFFRSSPVVLSFVAICEQIGGIRISKCIAVLVV